MCACCDCSFQGLLARWEVLDRHKSKKVASAERQKNRQIESVKNMFESEVVQVDEQPSTRACV